MGKIVDGGGRGNASSLDSNDGRSPTSSTAWTCGCPLLFESHDANDDKDGDDYDYFQNRPIGWYRKKRVPTSPKGVEEGGDGCIVTDVSGWLMEDFGHFLLGGPSGMEKETTEEMRYVAVLATMTVADTDENGPEIQIRAMDDDIDNDDGVTTHAALRDYVLMGKPWWGGLKDRRPSTVVPLYIVDSVTSIGGGGGQIVLHAAPVAPPSKDEGGSISKILSGMMMTGGNRRRELLRFDLLSCRLGDKPDEDNVEKVITRLKSIVVTNRRKMAKDIIDGKAIVAPKSTVPGYVTSG